MDKCYGNIKNAYTAKSKPPLANSDHNTIHLIPTYKSLLKRSKPQLKTVMVWSDESIETLKACFSCTGGSIFYNTNIDDAVESVTGYISFCVENVVTQKNIVVYPNNKPNHT